MPTETAKRFEQLQLANMEFGLAQPVAVIGLKPEELSRRLGLRFEAGKDDLDDLVATLFQSMAGRQVALVRHANQPEVGTTILINEKSDDFSRDLNAALEALRLSPKQLTWIHPAATARE